MDKPWIDGAKELLNHANEHLTSKSDFDKRIAYISIDNAVELIIKTSLGLPQRVRKTSGPSRKEMQEAENSFPKYLDLLEKYDSDKLVGISLEDIEWYHRIRNQLYHSGNGITVELSKVETYFEISKALYENLFNEKLKLEAKIILVTKLGIFMNNWIKFENKLRSKLPPKNDLAYHWKRDFLEKIDKNLVPIFNELTVFRNNVVHGIIEPAENDFDKMINYLEMIDHTI